MAFSFTRPVTWLPGRVGGTKITADRLNEMQDGIGEQIETFSDSVVLGDQLEAEEDAREAGDLAVVKGTDAVVGASVLSGLSQIQRRLDRENDAAPTTFRTIGLGSSVGVGPNGGTSFPNDTVTARIHAVLTAHFNRLGRTWAAHNGSVNGTTVFGGASTDYEAAKTAAGGVPVGVPMAYGMNEGTCAQYHAGLTLPGVYTSTVSLCRKIQADGGDPIVVIGPHPHTGRATWVMPNGVEATYAGSGTGSTAILIPAPEDSIVMVESPSGEMVPASYRHLRVNEAMRRGAIAAGAIIVDAEPYWFDAVAEHGEDALFNVGEIVHPNLLGFQRSYHLAIADFARALRRPSVLTAPSSAAESFSRVVSNETYSSTTRATSAALQFLAQPNSTYEVDIEFQYTVPTPQDARIGWEVPAGATGRFSAIGPSPTTAAVNNGEVIARSTLLSSTIPLGGNTADAAARVRALVTTGATGGTVGLQVGLDVTGGTCTVYGGGSSLRARKVA